MGKKMQQIMFVIRLSVLFYSASASNINSGASLYTVFETPLRIRRERYDLTCFVHLQSSVKHLQREVSRHGADAVHLQDAQRF